MTPMTSKLMGVLKERPQVLEPLSGPTQVYLSLEISTLQRKPGEIELTPVSETLDFYIEVPLEAGQNYRVLKPGISAVIEFDISESVILQGKRYWKILHLYFTSQSSQDSKREKENCD